MDQNKIKESFHSFMEGLDNPVPDYVLYDTEFYLNVPELIDTATEISKSINRTPFSVGTSLGHYDKKTDRFVPSFQLLETIESPMVIINDKAEWLFLCKKNVLESSIINLEDIRGLVEVKKNLKKLFLVVNKKKEILGLGELTMNKDEIVVKNRFDRGNFLRRERK